MRVRRIDASRVMVAYLVVAETEQERVLIDAFLQNQDLPAPPPPPPPPTSTVNDDDVLVRASGSLPFAQQAGYNTQVISQYLKANEVPETGINGPAMADGSTLRFGKVKDPTNPAKTVLQFALAPNDVPTSGSRRAELSFHEKLDYGKVYWLALGMYVPDWGQLDTSDVATVGLQVHGAGPGLSPAIQIASRGGRTFWIDARTSSSNPATANTSTSNKSPDLPLPINRWADIVVRFKLDPAGNGFVQAWMDGTQVWDFAGSVGYNTPGVQPYIKFGYYNWTNFKTDRRVLLRNPTLVRESSYTHEAVRALIHNP